MFVIIDLVDRILESEWRELQYVGIVLNHLATLIS